MFSSLRALSVLFALLVELSCDIVAWITLQECNTSYPWSSSSGVACSLLLLQVCLLVRCCSMWDMLSSWWIIGRLRPSLIYGILLRGRLYIGHVTCSDAYLQRRKTELFNFLKETQGSFRWK
jgi:hypothetical protein